MKVRELWRYPVKSLGGERLEQAEVTSSGLVGDRGYAIFDATTGLGLTARRVPQMLFARARWRDDDGAVQITLPDGRVSRGDDDLSAWLGRPVSLRAASQVGVRLYESASGDEQDATWSVFSGAGGAFHDSSRARVTLLSTTTAGTWDRRRFRANVILDGRGEDEAVGRTIRLGETRLHITKQIERCVMVTRPQPDGVSRDLDVLRTIHRERGGCMAVGALVTRPGAVRLGDLID